MTLYFTAEIDGLADANLHLDTPAHTDNVRGVALALEAYRYDIRPRPRRPLPH